MLIKMERELQVCTIVNNLRQTGVEILLNSPQET